MSDVAAKSQLSIRAPGDVIAALDSIATALDRDRSWVMLRAFRLYLDGEGGDVLADAKGLAALDRGEGVDFDSVMEEADEIIAAAKTRQTQKAS